MRTRFHWDFLDFFIPAPDFPTTFLNALTPYNENFTLQFRLYMLRNVAVITAGKNVKFKINNVSDDCLLLLFKAIWRIAFALIFIMWWCTILCVEYASGADEYSSSIFLAVTLRQKIRSIYLQCGVYFHQILRKYFLPKYGVNISVCSKNVFKNPNNSSTTKSENISLEWIVWNVSRNKMNNSKSSYNFDNGK